MGLVVAGYILAVFVPLVGFILGIVVATRPQKRLNKHGVWIVVVSIVVTALYLVVVLHSGRGSESASLRL
jgi:positive regulator of sigma E activity